MLLSPVIHEPQNGPLIILLPRNLRRADYPFLSDCLTAGVAMSETTRG